MAHRIEIFYRQIYRQIWHRVWLAVLLVCLPIGACNCNSSTDAAAKDDAKVPAQANEPAKGEPATEEAAAENFPDEVYQDFNFDQFSQKERGTFVRVARAELCPCPDATASLHECLKTRETRCRLAEESASMIGAMVKASFNETDILDKLAELIESSRKVWEFTLTDRPFKGKVGAPVTIVEFADFQCPHCKEASKIMKSLSAKFPDDVVVYYKHYPLGGHQFSQEAAKAATAAHRQNKFWPMHDLLFKHQLSLSAAKIEGFGRQIGLNMKKFQADMQDPAVAAIVAQDKSEGDMTGLTGTPTIYINGKRFTGELAEPALTEAIKASLADAETTDTPQ